MSTKVPTRPNSRWATGKTAEQRYPGNDPGKDVLRKLAQSRSAAGWRNGARIRVG